MHLDILSDPTQQEAMLPQPQGDSLAAYEEIQDNNTATQHGATALLRADPQPRNLTAYEEIQMPDNTSRQHGTKPPLLDRQPRAGKPIIYGNIPTAGRAITQGATGRPQVDKHPQVDLASYENIPLHDNTEAHSDYYNVNTSVRSGKGMKAGGEEGVYERPVIHTYMNQAGGDNDAGNVYQPLQK